MFNVHHIVFDGWSLGLLSSELAALYASAVTGTPAQLAELPVQYPDYCSWQREWLSGRLDELADYWREHLAGLEVRQHSSVHASALTEIGAGGELSAQASEVLATFQAVA